jgi:hypothetical protein
VQSGSRFAQWFLPFLFVLWVNIHGAFVAGLALVVLFLTERFVWPAPALSRSTVLGLGVACLGVLVLNPRGVYLFGYLADELSRSHPITEWQSTSIAAEHASFFCLSALVLVALFFGRRLKPYWTSLAALGLLVLAFRHQRHIPVFALCAVPFLANQLDAGGKRVSELWCGSLSGPTRSLVAGLLLAVALFQGGYSLRRPLQAQSALEYVPSDYPYGAVRFMYESGCTGNVALPLEWGEFVLWHLNDQIKVSLDGRFATVYPESVVRGNFALLAGDPGWREFLDTNPTTAVLVPGGVSTPWLSQAGFEKVYGDGVATLLAAKGTEFCQAGVSRKFAAREGIFP